jgi:ArsR family transcriptional regulator
MIDATATSATSVAELAKALADPTRVQIVDVLRAAPGAVCQCELNALFDVSQPTLSHHLKKLRDAGFVDVERRGKWAYYSIDPRALEALDAWLS